MRTHTLLLAAVGIGLTLAGCSRQHFRERADKDVEGVITQKNVFPQWQVENWHVYPDPRSRFVAPGQQDYPPYPPDDYASRVLSPNPQHPGRGGAGRYEGDGYLKIIAAWDCQNRAEDAATAAAEKQRIAAGKDAPDSPAAADQDRIGGYKKEDAGNPSRGEEFAAVAGGSAAYLRAFNSTQTPFRLRLDQAVELSLFNAREFQDRREDVYLAALPVTLERFNLGAQFFATEQVIREATGTLRPEGLGNRYRINTTPGFSRTFATGATLMVQLANQVVVNFADGKMATSFSDLTATLIQPLARGGGYAVTLENLTQAERTLLYAIRSFARFRHLFYYAVVGGGNLTNNPYGLQGLSINLGRGVGANLTANPVGYLPTILQEALLDNQRKNVTTLEQFLRLFQNFREGGVVPELQVVRVEQNLLAGRTTVLAQTLAFLNNVDFFKLQLGVPTTMPIEFDNTPLRPIRKQLNRFEQVYADLRQVQAEGGRFDPAAPPAALRARWENLLTRSSLARDTRFGEQYRQSAAELRGQTEDALLRRLADLAAVRRRLLDAKADREGKGQPDSPAQVAELDRVDAAADRVRFERALRQYESGGWQRLAGARRLSEQGLAFRQAFEAGILVAVQVRNERLATIRGDWPAFPPVRINGCDVLALPLDEAYVTVGQAALTNRLDLMNVRGQVVDFWRQITVSANALRGVLNVQYNLDAQTDPAGTTGLAFSGPRAKHQLQLTYQPPFVRRAERNAYRQSLINYQRSRRALMAYEDNILVDTRTDLRNLRQLAAAYALQKRAAELAYSQVDNALSTFTAPPDPGAPDSTAAVAALTQQLLDAQNTLLNTQNALYTTWTTFLNIRLELFLDTELLSLDARGALIDAPAPDNQPAPAGPDPGPAGVERLGEPRPAAGR